MTDTPACVKGDFDVQREEGYSLDGEVEYGPELDRPGRVDARRP